MYVWFVIQQAILVDLDPGIVETKICCQSFL